MVASAVTAPVACGLGVLAVSLAAGSYLNPDGASYLSIADAYRQGRWGDAVSGYWGPLLSWSTAPLLAVGVEPVTAVRAVLGVAAVAATAAVRVVLDRCGVRATLAGAGALATVPLVVWSATFGVYPEVVLIGLLVVYALVIDDPTQTSAGRAAAAGLIGGLAYLTKAVGLPLVLGHLVLWGAVAWWSRGRPGLIATGAALVGVAVLAAPWAAVVSLDQDRLTFSTAVGFNDGLVGSQGNPLLYGGLYELSSPGARSAWDDPTDAIDGSRWPRPAGPDGPPQIDTRAEAVRANVGVVAGSVARRALVPAVLAAATVTWFAGRLRRPPAPAANLVVLAATSLVGYGLVTVVERYLWLAMIVAVIVATIGVARVLDPRRPGLALGLVALVGVSTAAGSGAALSGRLGDHDDLDDLAERNPELAGARVVGVDDWDEALALCVHADCRYLGLTGTIGVVDDDDLARFDIDYIVDPGGSEPVRPAGEPAPGSTP